MVVTLRKIAGVFLLGVTTALMSAQLAAAPITVPVSSTFDADLDGWTPLVPSETSFGSPDGNPGGYVRIDDATGTSGQILAPAKFLGDWSALDAVGKITFDHKLFSTGFIGSDGIVDYEINISGTGNSARWTQAAPSGATDWVTLMAPILESEWLVTGSWADLLASVSEFRVRIELVDNDNSTDRDIAGVDNVFLTGVTVPEPTTLALLALGLVGVGIRRRRFH